MSQTPATTVDILEAKYHQAMSISGLPYRSPSHRMAEQLAATAEAHAYAVALALITNSDAWESKALALARSLRGRIQMDQSDIDSAERAESKMKRYGLNHLVP